MSSPFQHKRCARTRNGWQGPEPVIRLEIAWLNPLNVFAVTRHGRYPELNETYGGLFTAAGGAENVPASLGWPRGDLASDADGAHASVCGLVRAGHAVAPTPDRHMARAGGRLHLLCRPSGNFDGFVKTVDALYAATLSVAGVRICGCAAAVPLSRRSGGNAGSGPSYRHLSAGASRLDAGSHAFGFSIRVLGQTP